MRHATPTYPLAAALFVGALTGPLSATQTTQQPQVSLQAAVHQELVVGDLDRAIQLYAEIATGGTDREVTAKALLYLGRAYEKLGSAEARHAYERVVQEFGDQRETAAEARSRLAAMGAQAGTPATHTMAARQVWTGDQVDFSGAISPSGRYLSFPNWETANLAIRNLRTGVNRDVTTEGSWDPDTYNYAEVSKWSPDETQLVYTRWINNAYELRLASIEGGESRLLYRHEDVYYPYPGGWSPDGKYVSMSLARWDGGSQLAMLSVDDGSMQVYRSFTVGGDGEGPGQADRFAPDGRYFAYSFSPSPTSNNRDLALMSRDGEQNVRLTETAADEDVLGWTPDGALLFKSNRTGRYALWMQRIANGQPVDGPALLMPDLGNVERLGTTDSGALYYGVGAASWDAFIAPLDPADGRVLGPPQRVDPSRLGTTGDGAWSPDGSMLAYRSLRGLDHALMVRPLASGREFELTRFSRIRHIQWHPSGTSLYVGGTYGGRLGLYSVALRREGATPQFVLERTGVLGPDGRTIFDVDQQFSEDRQTVVASALMRIDLESGRETVLYEWVPDDIPLRFAVSPDGRDIVFRSGPGTAPVLQLVSSSGGAPRFLAKLEYDGKPVRARNGFTWTPDGRHIVFFGDHWPGEGSSHEFLFRVPASGGALTPVGLRTHGPDQDPDLVYTMRRPMLSPDGKAIVFNARKHIAPAAVWVLENFLPIATQDR